MKKLPVRKAVRIILLNSQNELLLMCIDDPRTKSINGKYQGKFWVMIGGQIEDKETIIDAAKRELHEESGIKENEVNFGPVVWKRELDLILYGKPTHIDEKYIVAVTNKTNVKTTNLTQDEIGIIKELRWHSLSAIKESKEKIYPSQLNKYLPNIILKKFPKELVTIL